jgi:multidrug efflux pump
MYIFGFSINVLTLLGIVLAIGLVVDDAIVVLENIYSKIEAGINPKKAALEGANEIYFAVISTTVVLAAVFLPIIFLEGISGRLFREFGVVIAGSVLISAFVSLSLTPMLSARMLKHSEKQAWFYRVTEPFFVWLNQTYENALNSFFKLRWIAFLLVGGSAFLIYIFIQNVQMELAPQEDRNGFRIVATGPEGATFEYMKAFADEAATLVNGEIKPNETKASISVASPGVGNGQTNTAFVRVILESKDKRTRSQQEIVDALMPKIANLSTARTFISQEQSIGGSAGIGKLPLQFVIQASSLPILQEALPKFLEKTKGSKMFLFTDANLKFNKPQLKVAIDRDKAKSLGVSVQDIGQVLQLSFSGQRFGYFVKEGKQYQVIGQLSLTDRNKPVDLTNLYVRNGKGELIQLDNVVRFEEISTPPQIYRFNRYVSATVQGQMAKGYTLADGIAEMERISKEVLDERYTTSLDGGARDFKESSTSILFSFGLALILIYLILAAQFESFSAPFLIMLTVPLAGVGALGALWYFKQTLNIFSEIGIIMLIGLVTKNGILIVEFANQQLALGLTKNEAVIKAAISRFRPILMTSLSAMLGAVPIALAFGAGAESRVSMGIVIIYGLFFSTILTLFVIPALYGYFVQTPKVLVQTTLEKTEDALIDA